MKKPNITPGPWERIDGTNVFTGLGAKNAHGQKCMDTDGWAIHLGDEVGLFAVGVPDEGSQFLPHEEGRANAQAIAAVPEMLDALIECYKLGDKVLHDEEINIEDWIEAMRPTEKALKKAGVEL